VILSPVGSVPTVPSENSLVRPSDGVDRPGSQDRYVENIVEAVARTEHTSPLSLPPLVGTIDSDALPDFLHRYSSDRISVGFSYRGYDVTVHGDGRVDVAESK